MIHVGMISALGRMRDVDPKQVEALAESIKEVGLLNPITVYKCQIIRNGLSVDGFGLVAGAHRLEACKRLGWSEVPAVVVELDDLDRIIAECDENLCASKLTAAELAMFTAKRKEAYEAKHPETRPTNEGGEGRAAATRRQLGDDIAPRFTADTAAKTGKSERAVQRDAERGEKISTAALAMVKGTALDTGAYLDKLKSVPQAKQPAKVQADLAELNRPKAKPAAPVAVQEPQDDYEVMERQVAALMAAWNRAGADARAEFLTRIGAA